MVNLREKHKFVLLLAKAKANETAKAGACFLAKVNYLDEILLEADLSFSSF